MHHLVIEEYELQVYISYRAASKKGFQNQDIYLFQVCKEMVLGAIFNKQIHIPTLVHTLS